MTAYLDSEDLKASIALQQTTFADDDIDLAISSASGMLDDELARRFDQQTATRLYTPTDPVLLEIDDLIELDSIRVTTGDDTWDIWTEGTEFRFEPLNAPADEKPWTHLRAINGYSFPLHAEALVEITGTFGWAAPPAAIVQATKFLVTQFLIRDRNAPFGVMIGDGAVAYISRNDPHLAGLLTRLSRRKTVRSLQLG